MAVRPTALEAVQRVTEGAGAAAALLSDPSTLRWIAGVRRSTDALLLVSAGAVEPLVADHGPPSHPAATRALEAAGIGPGHLLAVETSSMSPDLAARLDPRLVDVGPQLLAARARKDRDEIDLIVQAGRLVDAGQAAVRDALAPGTTELGLWETASAAMARVRDRPVRAIVDLMSGKRTTLVGAPPARVVVRAGDAVLFDLAPRHAGYWADSCTTISCTEPGAPLRRRHDAVLAALDVGIRAARPGVAAASLDRAMRDVLSHAGLSCPHHMGHGVGTAPQETPWITPGDATVLEEGMVVALEPGAYSDGIGLRLERLLLIEADGARPLTTHSMSLA